MTGTNPTVELLGDVAERSVELQQLRKLKRRFFFKYKQFPVSIVALNRGGSSNISDISSLYLNTDLVTIES